MIKPTSKLTSFIDSFKNNSSFAEAVGVHRSTVSRLLNGKRGISFDTAAKILKLSGMDFQDLFNINTTRRKR